MKKSAPDLVIFITCKKLTDGSKVYNVNVGNVELAAVTESDAMDLADKIVDAVNDHSVSTAGSVFDY
jgi:hypothetical protein